LLFLSPIASAQSPSDLVVRAVEAYDDLDLATAAGLIRRALAVEGTDALATEERLRALSYLGAAEFYRGNQDSVLSAFQRIVILDPRFQIDDVVFPPDVTSLFALVRRDTKVVQVNAPRVGRLRAGTGQYAAQLYASSYHEILATVALADGRPVRVLYSGLIGDSLEIYWNGLDSARVPVGTGRYFLTVESTGREGTVVRQLRVPLDVSASSIDTLPLPARPADSLFLPEGTSGGPAIETLLGGVVGGIAVALLPSAIASDTDLSAGRLAVGGAMTIAGVVGFFKQRGGQPIPQNIAANEAVRQEWQLRRDDIARQNAVLRAEVDLVIRAGRPVAVDLGVQ
jgi:hypothetical protein